MIKPIRRVVSINDNKTSICLTNLEWDAFDTLCEIERIRRNILINLIATYKTKENQLSGLTCGVRLFTLQYFKKQAVRPRKNQAQKPDFNNIFKILKEIFEN